jgi:hypothetical protein
VLLRTVSTLRRKEYSEYQANGSDMRKINILCRTRSTAGLCSNAVCTFESPAVHHCRGGIYLHEKKPTTSNYAIESVMQTISFSNTMLYRPICRQIMLVFNLWFSQKIFDIIMVSIDGRKEPTQYVLCISCNIVTLGSTPIDAVFAIGEFHVDIKPL